MKTAHVEVMPDIEDGAEMNKTEKKKHKKYVLKTAEKQRMKEEAIQEVAPPGKKYERMVKHIKKNYPKDKEGIAYATAWKHKNKKMKENYDKGEYDYEGDMAKTQLKGVIRNAQELHDLLQPADNLPEWVQSKITLAADYIQTASDYMKSK